MALCNFNMKTFCIFIVFISALTSSLVKASDNKETSLSKASMDVIDELQNQIKSSLLTIAEIEKNAGNNGSNIYYAFELPEQNLINFGLVLDVENPADGFNILSVSPGSEADKLGVVAGSKLIKINDININKQTSEQSLSVLQNLAINDPVSMIVATDKETKTINTTIKGTNLPAVKLEIGTTTTQAVLNDNLNNDDANANECGEVSVFFRPSEVKKLYNAYITSINGDGVNRMKKSFRLKPGKYQFKLHELIDDPFFKRRGNRLQKAKVLEINVKPNVRYDLAAKFLTNKRLSLRDDFWEPVIWRTSERKCEL